MKDQKEYKTPSTTDSMDIEMREMLPHCVELAWNHGYPSELNSNYFTGNTNDNSQSQFLSFSDDGIKREASFYDKSPTLKYIPSDIREEAFAFNSVILNSNVSYNLTRLINNSPASNDNNHQSQFLSSISRNINYSELEVEVTGVKTLNNGNITGNKREASEQGCTPKRMK